MFEVYSEFYNIYFTILTRRKLLLKTKLVIDFREVGWDSTEKTWSISTSTTIYILKN